MSGGDVVREARRGIRRHAGLIGWLFVVAGLMVALFWNHQLQERTALIGEIRAHELCVAQNETRGVLRGVLERLTAPRDTDEPGDQEERQRLFEQVEDLLEPLDCPPKPRQLSIRDLDH